MADDQRSDKWEQKTLETLLFAGLKEQRKIRRWNIFFRSFYLCFFLLLLLIFFGVFSTMEEDISATGPHTPHIALIQVNGPIFDDAEASSTNIIAALQEAYENKMVEGIMIEINSPGGSPVQAAEIFDEIVRLKKLNENHIKVIAVCDDICTSAAYYIAAATDTIYSNPSSLVGSIGVMLDSFGFVDALDKLGVQRRLLTAGTRKGFLDPFSKLTAEDKEHAQKMLDIIHNQFINAVKSGRGNRIKDNGKLFSGQVWTGYTGKELGLIDEFGSIEFVSREVFKNDNVVNYTLQPSYFEKLAQRIGLTFARSFNARFMLPSNGIVS